MDTPSHGLAGAILTRAMTSRPGARAALWLGFLAGMLPDADAFFLTGRLDYLRNHRGWSHSFVYLPFFALAMAAVARLFFRRARFADLWIFAAVGIASHILFDWITSFGTMFFTPLTTTRYSLDWVFILDLFFSGIGFVTLLLSLARPERGRRIALAGCAALAVYLGFCAILHARALEAWRRIDRLPPGAAAAVIPQLLSPFRWLGLSDHGGFLHACFFDIGPFARTVPTPRVPEKLSEALRRLPDFYPPPGRARIRTFEKPADSPELRRARSLPEVQTYLAFARFPLETVSLLPGGGAEVTFEDLRFLPFFTGPWARGKNGEYTREPFVYRVRLDGAGRVLERGFIVGGRGRYGGG
ncbi:MAG: metal-dependent hydrolase [Acidobacteria bacterium]|nr:metal-dependent hydrolase [Acidobacteriota bacterium]MCA1610962.1 metal-dependent hydrolase [Acidobacteriota bacterium]